MEVEIGKVTHFFNKISVAIIEITSGNLAIGDTLHIKGKKTDFMQPIESMQIEHQQVSSAKAGDTVGIKVNSPVREGDIVYKVEPES